VSDVAEHPRVALLTGAAGGMGRAIQRELESDGWVVIASDLPGTGVAYPVDLRDPAACIALVDTAVSDQGHLDLLVNNAATMYSGELTLADLERWWDTIDVNLSAPFRLARAALPALRRSRGQIINIASAAGVAADAGLSAYCSSKSGLIGLTKALALELAPEVRVNAIAPGNVDTPQQAVDAEAAGLSREELYAGYARTTPIGRILDPAEIGRLVVYLASETGFTGSCVHLNGGLLLV
jgi:NAD(P)-dependent dehydrogenase (short-subunit alcohol dehydrogenase family)